MVFSVYFSKLCVVLLPAKMWVDSNRYGRRKILMREKIVLIDGHSILNRAFYGVPDLTNSEGLHTNAVYGFLNIMFKILDEERPEYLTVTFDVHAPTLSGMRCMRIIRERESPWQKS